MRNSPCLNLIQTLCKSLRSCDKMGGRYYKTARTGEIDRNASSTTTRSTDRQSKFISPIHSLINDAQVKHQKLRHESFAKMRCGMVVPKNFILVIPDKNCSDQELTKDTTNVVLVYLTHVNYLVMVKAFSTHWKATYCDLMLYQESPAYRKHFMYNGHWHASISVIMTLTM